ncbi:MAG: hypothetical protein HFF22_04385 [Oscillospiraceae bacterium]|jgi:hypothetical protein|nr:hypothetical protein [Oscillospiraceae bacterium]
MDSELWGAGEVFLTLYAPALAGALGLALTALAWWDKLPKFLRFLCGAAGAAVLLLAAYIWFIRPVLLRAMY